MTKRPTSRETAKASLAQELGKDFFDLLLRTEEISRVMELCYWGRDEAVAEITRAVAALDEASKDAVRTFVAWAQDPRTITAKIERDGRLTLSAPRVAETFKLADYVTKGSDDDEEPEPLGAKCRLTRKAAQAA
jgi:hypothetical protein